MWVRVTFLYYHIYTVYFAAAVTVLHTMHNKIYIYLSQLALKMTEDNCHHKCHCFSGKFMYIAGGTFACPLLVADAAACRAQSGPRSHLRSAGVPSGT